MALGLQMVAVVTTSRKTTTPIKSVSNKECTHRHYVIVHRFNIILFVV